MVKRTHRRGQVATSFSSFAQTQEARLLGPTRYSRQERHHVFAHAHARETSRLLGAQKSAYAQQEGLHVVDEGESGASVPRVEWQR